MDSFVVGGYCLFVVVFVLFLCVFLLLFFVGGFGVVVFSCVYLRGFWGGRVHFLMVLGFCC